MTREQIYDLVLGAAAVAVAYMLWKQHKGQGGTCTDCGGAGLGFDVPPAPEIHGNAETGYWYDLPNLTAGVF